MEVELHDSFALHPGPWLREQVLKPYRMTEADAADHLQVTLSALRPSAERKGSTHSPHGNALRKGIWVVGSNVASDPVIVRSKEGEAESIVDQHQSSSTSSGKAHSFEPAVGRLVPVNETR